MNEYEPPLAWDPDLDLGFDWMTFGLVAAGGAVLLIAGLVFWPRR